MNTNDEKFDAVQSHCFDPFPEPQTIPSGWDTSAFYATPAAGETDSSAEVESC